MISKTFIINLARRTDKRKHMEAEFTKLANKGVNLNHEFIEAVDGSDPNALKKFTFNATKWADPNSNKALTTGEVGCSLSHWFCWTEIIRLVEQKICDTDADFLIVEDDVIFLDNFASNYKLYVSELADTTYDMLYLHRKPLNERAEIPLTKHITNIRKNYWACAYVLKYSGAKKLVSSGFLNNLIPVDEFLPIMYGCPVNGYEKYFDTSVNFKCFATKPSLLKLTGNAFNESETFHSNAFNDNDKYIFDDNREFLCLYMGPQTGHHYVRFQAYTKMYALPTHTITATSSQIDALHEYLSLWTPERLASTFVVVILVEPNDKCSIIPTASPGEILNNFNDIVHKKGNQIVVSTSDKYASKTLLAGWTNTLMQLLTDYVDHAKKLPNMKNKTFSTMIAFNTLLKNNTIVVDHKSQLFHLLDTGNITYNHRTSRAVVENRNITPCFLIASEPNAVITLNRSEDYTGSGWNEFYGYNFPKALTLDSQNQQPRIYISYRSGLNITNLMAKLNYPKNLIQCAVNDRYDVVKNFLESGCDYYFFINNKCAIENVNIINELLMANKDVIAPLLRRGEDAWTNFWGDLDEKGFYKRSFDYFDIINGKRRGCWNVPYITDCYLIKRSILELVPEVFTDNAEMDIDMRVCNNFREANVFMYVCNMNHYGYLIKHEDYVAAAEFNSLKSLDTDSSLSTDVTLFSIFDRKSEWEEKYIHPNVLHNLKNLQNMTYTEVCNDIYTFMLFTEEFCKDLIKLAELKNNWSAGKNNHVDKRLGNNYYENVPTVDVQLFQLGLEKIWQTIVDNYISKIAHDLYSNYITKNINLAFVVRYKPDDQPGLRPHHDSSTYTVNIALNRGGGVDYENGGCRFIRQNYTLTNQPMGSCCIHSGRLTAYHEGLPTTAGTRYILVSFIN